MLHKIDSATLAIGNYSTAEVGTSYKWTNGATIYKKTINFGAMPAANSNKSVAHGISNLGQIVDFKGNMINAAQTNRQPIPLATSSIFVWLDISSTDITISTVGDRSAYSAIVTLFYTKT